MARNTTTKKTKYIEAYMYGIGACSEHGTATIQLMDKNETVRVVAHIPVENIEQVITELRECTAEAQSLKAIEAMEKEVKASLAAKPDFLKVLKGGKTDE